MEDMKDCALSAIIVHGTSKAGGQFLGLLRNRSEYILRPPSYAGAVCTGDLAVVIRPNFPIDRVIFLIACSIDPKHRRRDAAELARDAAVSTAVVFAFTHHTKQAIHRGLPRSYREAADGAERTGETVPRQLYAPLRIYLGDCPGELGSRGQNGRPPKLKPR